MFGSIQSEKRAGGPLRRPGAVRARQTGVNISAARSFTIPGRPYGLHNEARRLLRRFMMPEVGGKQLASDFVGMMAEVRKAIDESKKTVADAVAELKAEI